MISLKIFNDSFESLSDSLTNNKIDELKVSNILKLMLQMMLKENANQRASSKSLVKHLFGVQLKHNIMNIDDLPSVNLKSYTVKL